VRPGDRIRVQPSGARARLRASSAPAATCPWPWPGRPSRWTLADEIDISRGDVISTSANPAEVADQFEATLLWMGEEPMLPGRPYLMKIGTRTVSATITEPKYKINVTRWSTWRRRSSSSTRSASATVSLDRQVAFDPYTVNRETGGFILIDRLSNNTVGAGMLRFALRRAHNIHLQPVDIDKKARAALKGQRPAVIWFTGLSGAGKSTIANLVEMKLYALGRHSYLLDGDNVRHGLNRDLGFTDEDRVENIRRVAEWQG